MIISKSEYEEICQRLNRAEQEICRLNSDVYEGTPHRNTIGPPRRLWYEERVREFKPRFVRLLDYLGIEEVVLPAEPSKTILRKRKKK